MFHVLDFFTFVNMVTLIRYNWKSRQFLAFFTDAVVCVLTCLTRVHIRLLFSSSTSSVWLESPCYPTKKSQLITRWTVVTKVINLVIKCNKEVFSSFLEPSLTLLLVSNNKRSWPLSLVLYWCLSLFMTSFTNIVVLTLTFSDRGHDLY